MLTFARLGLTVVFLGMILYSPRLAERVFFLDVAFVLFVVAGLTDIVDGHVARRFNAATKLGRMVDPLVDKVLVCGAFVCFAIIGVPKLFDWGPATLAVVHWLVAGILILREAYVTVLRHMAEARGVNFAAVASGKMKTFVQIFGVGTVVIKMAHVQTAAWGSWFTMVVFVVMIVVTVYSGIDYQIRWRRSAAPRRPLVPDQPRATQGAPREHPFSSMPAGSDGRFPWRAFGLLSLVSLLPFLGAWLDRSLFLPGNAIGMFEHYGNMCFTVALPLVFILAVRGIRYFDKFIGNVGTNLVVERLEKKVDVRRLEASLASRPYMLLGFFLISAGFALATVNAVNAFRSEEVWGHDVYDSSRHLFGYIAQRIFYYVWWAYVLPVLVLRLCSIVVTLNRLFRVTIETDSLVLYPMHPDNAGGLGAIGKMALNFNLAMLVTMSISATLYFTHGYNAPLAAGMAIQFLLLPVVFFLPLLRVHEAMKRKKKALLLEVSKHYQRVSGTLLQKLANPGAGVADTYDGVREEFDGEFRLGGLYRSLESMPTWPFDARTITQFSFSILLPVMLSLFEFVR